MPNRLRALCTLALLALAASRLPAQDAGGPALAVGGLDPVELCRGRETPGSPELTSDHLSYRYRFASEAHRARFRADPERWGIQWGGGCGGMGPLSGTGDPDRYVVWDGRIWIFASDQCRRGFLKDPTALIGAPDPRPAADAESVARGRALLAKVLAAVGGAERVDGMRVLRTTSDREVESGGKTYANGEVTIFDFGGAIRREVYWDAKRWTDVLTPEGGFREASNRPNFAMAPSQRDELMRQAGHDLVWLLRHRGREGFRVAAGGTEALEGRPVARLDVHLGDAGTTWLVDPESGKVLASRYRDRPGSGPLKSIEVRWSDWRTIAGLTLPFGRTATADGKSWSSGSYPITAIDVDPLAEDSWFRP